MLNDFLAAQPTQVLKRVEVTEERVCIPVAIKPDSFYKTFKTDIESEEVYSVEKALYAASKVPVKDSKSISRLLVKGR